MARSNDMGPPQDNSDGQRSEPGRDGPSIHDYQLKEKIGEGSFGTVWRAERDGIFVALKELNKSLDSKETQDELKSLEALKKLHHKALLKTENSWTETGRLYIEMELADGGSLKDRLKAFKAMGKAGIPEDELLKFFTETAQAIDYLHRQTPVMLHRDIKPGNILLVKGCAKIADFGLLRQVTGDKSATRTQGGTLLYLAPESIANDMASVHTDLWSFAVTYVELRQGTLPFAGKSIGQIYDRIRWEPPELSDIFDPEEKKVILKALNKDPKSRHTSCYDFVFQLNRVVPWTPAQEIPVMDLAPDPAVSAPTPMLHPGSHGGLTAKNNQGPTRSDIALPQYRGAGTPTPATDLRSDATEKNFGSARTPHRVDTKDSTAVPAPKPTETAKPVPAPAPKSSPAPAPRRRSRAPVIGAALLLTLIFGLAAVIWFVASSHAEQQVQAEIKEGKYATALATIDSTHDMVLRPANKQKLRDDVEKNWWKKLKEQKDASIELLGKFPKELDEFKEHFPNYPGIENLRDERAAALRKAVEAKVIEYLDEGKTQLAHPLFTEHRSKLDGHIVKELEQKIKDKDDATSLLDHARKYFKNKDYDACRDLLVKAKTPFDKKDNAEKIKLLEKAKFGIEIREAANEKQVKAFLDSAWLALENSDVKTCREKMEPAKEQLEHLASLDKNKGSPAIAKFADERSLLESLANLFDAVPDGRDDTFKTLIEKLRTQAMHPRPWKFLVQLQTKEQKSFSVQEIDQLEKVYAGLSPVESVRGAYAELLLNVLERTSVRIKADGWYPSKAERTSFLAWFKRIDAPLSNYLKALKAECLLESGAGLETIATIESPPQNDWYGRYVQALVEEKKGAANSEQYAKAAGLVLEVLKEKPRLGSHRQDKALTLLRGAVKSARGGDRNNWWDKDNARRAIPWLETLLKFAEPKESAKDQEVDDLVELAFAAVRAEDEATLEDAVKRFASPRFDDSAKQKGHLGLARAYFEKGKSDKVVVDFLQKALRGPDKGPVRMKIDEEIKIVATHLNLTAKRFVEMKVWDDAVATSELCEDLVGKWQAAGLGDNLEQAADLYAEAVYNRAVAKAVRDEPSDQFAEIYRVYQTVTKMPDITDGFRVALTFRKLKSAGTKARLDEVIPEGENAVKLAEKGAVVRKLQKNWWETKECMVLVALGEAKERAIKFVASTLTPDEGVDRMIAASANYRKASEMAQYPDAWYPWYKLGAAYANCVDTKYNEDHARLAQEQLSKAENALKALENKTANQQDILGNITMRLQRLKKSSGN